MNKQLLIDYFPLEYDSHSILTESSTRPDNKVVIRKAILQRANAQNQNKRVYPKELLVREAQTYLTEFVNQRAAAGELDHPESETVNLKNVSHKITEMHWEGDDLIGTIEIASTPAGNIVKELIRSGIRIGVSSRGVGSVRQVGESLEVEDYKLICFDIVSNPSTHGAFLMEGIQPTISTHTQNKLYVEALMRDFLEIIPTK